MRLTFYGGAQTVTGSNYLLEAGGKKILIDCGLFQGTRYSEHLNYDKFPYDPATVDALIVTHSHADHVGRIPKLYRDGFRGAVYSTEPTVAIMGVALPDTLDKITDEARADGHEPLYGRKDIAGALSLVQSIGYRQPISIGEAVSVVLHEASHILGSAIVEIVVAEDGKERRVVFSGDLGNPPTVLLNPIDYVANVDYAVIESAYGNRIHEQRAERRTKLLAAVRDTVKRGGVLMIPSFAIERTQELLLELDILFEKGQLPRVPFFVDSPLAIKMSRVYGTFSHYFNPEAVKVLRDNKGLFQFPWLKVTSTVEESKAINDVPSPKIIIAGSGMSQGGRILHHERRYLPGAENSILFIGYQVSGSLGRRILDGVQSVSMFGEEIPVRCKVQAIGAYSAHADQEGLLRFIEHARQGEALKRVFVVQGEADPASALAQHIHSKTHIDAHVPMPGEIIDLN